MTGSSRVVTSARALSRSGTLLAKGAATAAVAGTATFELLDRVLTPAQRDAFLLWEATGVGYGRLGELLGISRSSARDRMQSALSGCGRRNGRALEWRDVDRQAVVLVVERAFAYGELKSYGKTARSRRRVRCRPVRSKR